MAALPAPPGWPARSLLCWHLLCAGKRLRPAEPLLTHTSPNWESAARPLSFFPVQVELRFPFQPLEGTSVSVRKSLRARSDLPSWADHPSSLEARVPFFKFWKAAFLNENLPIFSTGFLSSPFYLERDISTTCKHEVARICCIQQTLVNHRVVLVGEYC